MANIGAEYDVVLVARSDGVLAADVRPLVQLSVTVIVEEDGRREQGYSGGGGRHDLAYFTEERLAEYAHKAVDQALVNLDATTGPGRRDAGRARSGLAGHPAARSRRPRTRGRLQPQGLERLCRPHRRTCGIDAASP